MIAEPIFTEDANIYPYIAPDESYLLFGSTRPGGNSKETDLYISFNTGENSWSDPIHLNESINNGMSVSFPFVSYEGKYLFFNRFDSTGTDRFYWTKADFIEDLKP